MSNPQIAIVIPTHNRKEDLRSALFSIARQTGSDFECVVVDNGPSTDGTPEMFAETVGTDARFRLVITGPIGIFPAVNRGFAETTAPLVLVMDDDVELVEAGTLDYVIDVFASNDSAGVIGLSEFYSGERHKGHQKGAPESGRVRALGDTRLYAPGKINRWGLIGTKFHQLPFGEAVTVDHVRSSAMAVRREAYDRVGGFFEPYTAAGRGYRCETDFCLGVRRAGFEVVFSARDPQVLHKQAQRKAGYDCDVMDREYLIATGCSNTFFFLSNFWTRKTALLFLAWDMLIGNTSQPGIARLLKKGVWAPAAHWHALVGKWRGLKFFWQYGQAESR